MLIATFHSSRSRLSHSSLHLSLVLGVFTATCTYCRPGNAESLITFIPNANSLVGVSADGTTAVGQIGNRAFVWTAATGAQDIGDLHNLDGPGARPMAISADGNVVVGIAGLTAFRWTAQTGMQIVGGGLITFNSAIWPSASAISADGSVIVGAMNPPHQISSVAYTYSSQGFYQLGTIAPPGITAYQSYATGISGDGSVVVGFNQTSAAYDVPFAWTAATGMYLLNSLPGQQNTDALAISRDGSTIVGRSGTHAVEWTASNGLIDLGLGTATGVSADGSMIFGTGTAFSNGYRFTTHTTTLPELPFGGICTAISDNGRTVLGYTVTPDGNHHAFVSTLVVPEPSSVVLLLSALVCLQLGRRNMFRRVERPRTSS